jgi:dienelactone hydrolase
VPDLCVLMATIAYGTAVGHCQAPQAGTTTITVQSSTYSDFRQVLVREAATRTVTIRATLSFPEEVRDRYPAVVVVHTLGGYRDVNEGYVAAELRKSGFATLTYDSLAARGTTGMAMQGSPGYLPAGVVDAYAALRRLSSEPKIDANRIAIVGFSFGAEVAHLTAFESLRAALIAGQGRFAAHVAFYPAGTLGVIAERGSYTKSPGVDAAWRKRRQSAGGKGRELSGLRPRRGESGPDRNRDLPGRLPCVDGSRPRHCALLPGLSQREKMSAYSARTKAANVPHRRSNKAVRPRRLRRVPARGSRVLDGI